MHFIFVKQIECLNGFQYVVLCCVAGFSKPATQRRTMNVYIDFHFKNGNQRERKPYAREYNFVCAEYGSLCGQIYQMNRLQGPII